MATVIPFRGIYYNTAKVSGQEVMAPPYDVITPEMKEELYAKSPFNTVRIDFGQDFQSDDDSKNRYSRAAKLLKQWLADGVLLRSEAPSYYAYRVDYTLDGRAMSMAGFFGLVRLVELGRGVYPHEATHSKPKLDRLTLLKVTGANTSPIFSLYSSPGNGASSALAQAMSAEPGISCTDEDGAVHSMWIVQDERLVEAISADMDGRDIFIADGHHRYETAYEYRRAMHEVNPVEGEEPYDFVMMFLANTDDDGLSILPTHRVLNSGGDLFKKLDGQFEITDIPPGVSVTEVIKGRTRSFGLYHGGKYYVLRHTGEEPEGLEPGFRDIDVMVLHRIVFDGLLELDVWGYEMDPVRGKELVDGGKYDTAFYLNPTRVGDVGRVALASVRMPPKSTYFYPKIKTGFVINSLKSF